MNLIIDAHVHVSTSWYEPIERLLEQMDANGVARAVLVQESARFDNAYLFACAARFPGRFAVVANIDPALPEVLETVRRLAALGATGIRLAAAVRSEGRDPLAVWRVAAAQGLAISCHGPAAAYLDTTFRDAVLAAASVPVIAEHLAAAPTRVTEPADLDQRVVVLASLASLPNLHLKFHGLGEFAARAHPAADPFPFLEPVPPLLERAGDLFGPERMMWGSDFPPVSQREGYRNALQLPMERMRRRWGDEAHQMFGSVAARIFWPDA